MKVEADWLRLGCVQGYVRRAARHWDFKRDYPVVGVIVVVKETISIM